MKGIWGASRSGCRCRPRRNGREAGHDSVSLSVSGAFLSTCVQQTVSPILSRCKSLSRLIHGRCCLPLCQSHGNGMGDDSDESRPYRFIISTAQPYQSGKMHTRIPCKSLSLDGLDVTVTSRLSKQTSKIPISASHSLKLSSI